MKKYQLNKKDFVKEKELNYIFVDKLSLSSNKKSIELAIEYFNEEYRWYNMFTISDFEKII